MIELTAADFNGDGALDLAMILAVSDGGNRLVGLLNDGAGKFATSAAIANPIGNPVALAAGDFNGDGKLDVAVATDLELDLLGGDGQGSLQAASSIAPIVASELVAADINGDGALDLVLATPLGIFLVANRGDGTFYPPGLVSSGQTIGVATGDFNGDGVPDVVFLALVESGLATMVVELGGCR